MEVGTKQFATTEQSTIDGSLRDPASQSQLFDFMVKSGNLMSLITNVDRDVKPFVITGIGGYNLSDASLVNNQYNTHEVTTDAELKLDVRTPAMIRYNTRTKIRVTYEVFCQNPFADQIAERQLLNACTNITEKMILYGSPTKKGVLELNGIHKKNWAKNDPAPKGSGGYFVGEGIFKMFQDYCDLGFELENCKFLAGTKAYNQLKSYVKSGRSAAPLVDYKSDGSPTIHGIPMLMLRSLKPEEIIFGDFRQIMFKKLDMSFKIEEADNRTRTYFYNSAFEVGCVEKASIFRCAVHGTNYDKNVT